MRKAQLGQACSPESFLWATGIEDTFITAPYQRTGRTLDEYELTGHYRHWREDLELMAELGVSTVRYGIPWHKVNPAPGQWDWEWPDKTLGRLLELGIDPIVDLVHYGLPPWIERAFLNPNYPECVAEYARRVAERFKGSIHSYTPLNEPRITAWYCGKLGWWPPFKKGWSGFVEVMLQVCRGIVETVRALEKVDSEILPVHVDATDLYETEDPALQSEVEHRQRIVFLALDLISGRIDSRHPLTSWLVGHGASDDDLSWFQSNQVDLPLVGINMYPMFSRKVLTRSDGRLRLKMPYSSADIVGRLGAMYWDRYQSPVFISEIASTGSVRRRLSWLNDSVDEVRKLRQAGVPLIGYTWWPLFALVTWAHRQGTHPTAYYLKQMGLWDLDPAPDADLRRVRTSLVDVYQKLAAGGTSGVGRLQNRHEERSEYVS